MILVSTLRNAKENGTDTDIKMIMVIANLALKLKMKSLKKLKWIKTEIILMIARLKAVKKV